jgi:hypothetical protein
MRKYAHIQDLINRLTEDQTFKTFFTIYLMAENDNERQVLNNRFWQDVASLNEIEQQLIRAEFTRCFLKLPNLTAQLLKKVHKVELV